MSKKNIQEMSKSYISFRSQIFLFGTQKAPIISQEITTGGPVG